MKRVIYVVVLVAFFGAAFYVYQEYQKRKSKEAASLIVKEASVRTATVLQLLDEANYTELPGKINDAVEGVDKLLFKAQMGAPDDAFTASVEYLRACRKLLTAVAAKYLALFSEDGVTQLAPDLEEFADGSRHAGRFLDAGVLVKELTIRGPLDRVRTIAGVLEVQRGRNGEEMGRRDTLSLNDSAVLRTKDEFMSIDALYVFPDREVAMFSVNGGGSASLDQYGFFVLRPGVTPKLLRSKDFFSITNSYHVARANGGLTIDLGWLDGKKKTAVLTADDGLRVDIVKVVAAEPIGDKDCKQLYELVLQACSTMLEDMGGVPKCKDGVRGLSMVSQSWFDALGQHPRVNSDLLNRLCVSACETKVVPEYFDFSIRVCGNN